VFSFTRKPGLGRRCRLRLEQLESRWLPSSAYSFTTGAPDGAMATASAPGSVESADDFVLSAETLINRATVTGLLPSGATVSEARVEIYRGFPFDSNTTRIANVPARANGPADIALAERDSAAGALSFTLSTLNTSFSAKNSVVSGIHPAPNQQTGGEGAASGQEVQLSLTFATPLDLPAGHYFFVPQVQVSTGNFLWLSAAPQQFSGDAQEWIRSASLAPDWLRVGSDIVGGTTPPTFNAAFSLSGTVTTPNYSFSTGTPDGGMATASQAGSSEIESADDFALSAETVITQATFTGLLPLGTDATTAVQSVRVEIYRLFPLDSNTTRTPGVPTRTNSPSDGVYTDRDSAAGSLVFGTDVLAANFTAHNSVVSGIHASPNQQTGGDGPVNGEEVRFSVNFASELDLPAGHYFFVPQVQVSTGNFLWLSTAPKQFSGDLQEWIRNTTLAPDWLRVGSDIVGGTTPPTFNAAFSLSGFAVPPNYNLNSHTPDGRMATASAPGGAESADDFTLKTETVLTQATITGLLPAGADPTSAVSDVRIEIYRAFPFDSSTLRTPAVPNRNGGPSDVTFAARDSSVGNLVFGTAILAPIINAANSVVTGIHASPTQTTGGDGPVTGEEVRFDVTLPGGLDLPAGHYFVVPQIQLTSGNFLWLSTAHRNRTGNAQTWIRNAALSPDWLRVGKDIVGSPAPPQFDAAFSLQGHTQKPVRSFSTGAPDGRMATAAQPGVESADDFTLSAETVVNAATFTGLLPVGTDPATAIASVRVEIFRVFPQDSDSSRTAQVPTRTGSPADTVLAALDSSSGGLTFGTQMLAATFTAANSVVSGIHASPNQQAGGDGAVTGEEVKLQVRFLPGFDLPAGHYFIVPQVQLASGNFLWLSAKASGNSQAWIRNTALAPDWLRVGADIVGGASPPAFDASFSLSGEPTVPFWAQRAKASRIVTTSHGTRSRWER
jgi:hypothetical protein